MPSPKKPLACLDPTPELWDAGGSHPPVLDCCYEPVTAKALEAKRRKIVNEAVEAAKHEPRITDLDVWALVVRCGVRNTPDNRNAWMQLVAYAKAHCGEAMVHYLWKKRANLPTMLDDIWEWECIEDVAAAAQRTRIETLTVAAASACSCGGSWLTFVLASLIQNGINVPELCHDVLDALTRGRSETTPVIVLAGVSGGEGKSMFLKPLHDLFNGFVFNLTKDSGNFPLLDLMTAKVAFLDEFRFDEAVLSWASQCLLFDGSPVPVGTPKNVPGMVGNMLYKGTAPVFITTKMADLEWMQKYAEINPVTGSPWDAEASMICRRLKVYRFATRVAKPRKQITCCRRCFCQLLRSQAAVRVGH